MSNNFIFNKYLTFNTLTNMKKYLFPTVLSFLMIFLTTAINAQSCSGSASMNVTIAPALSVSGNVVDVGCGGALGSITTNVSGSTMPYTYNWSNNETTATISNLSAGNYTVTVTGANGCSKTQAFTVNATGGSLTINGVVTDAGCVKGSITTSVSGGTGPYTYAWSNGKTTANITNLNAGTYTVTASDNGGCTGTNSFLVNDVLPMPVLANPIATCNSITMNWTGPNTGSYEVKYKSSTFSSPTYLSPSMTTYTFTNLTANTRYKVSVRYLCPIGNKKSGWVTKTKMTPACFQGPGENSSNLISLVGDATLQVFPNPASDEVNITFISEKTEIANMQVQNSLGQQMTIQQIPSRGEVYRLDTRNYAPGIYWVTIRQGDITQSSKLVINR
jgi:hypothetical protein